MSLFYLKCQSWLDICAPYCTIAQNMLLVPSGCPDCCKSVYWNDFFFFYLNLFMMLPSMKLYSVSAILDGQLIGDLDWWTSWNVTSGEGALVGGWTGQVEEALWLVGLSRAGLWTMQPGAGDRDVMAKSAVLSSLMGNGSGTWKLSTSLSEHAKHQESTPK